MNSPREIFKESEVLAIVSEVHDLSFNNKQNNTCDE